MQVSMRHRPPADNDPAQPGTARPSTARSPPFRRPQPPARHKQSSVAQGGHSAPTAPTASCGTLADPRGSAASPARSLQLVLLTVLLPAASAMSFHLSEVIGAAAPTVVSLLADVRSIKQLFDGGSGATASPSQDIPRRRVYLRSEVSVKCTLADAASGVVQHELRDGYHLARYTWDIRPLPGGGSVRVELRVSPRPRQLMSIAFEHAGATLTCPRRPRTGALLRGAGRRGQPLGAAGVDADARRGAHAALPQAARRARGRRRRRQQLRREPQRRAPAAGVVIAVCVRPGEALAARARMRRYSRVQIELLRRRGRRGCGRVLCARNAPAACPRCSCCQTAGRQ
jgi:hypothetical protein